MNLTERLKDIQKRLGLVREIKNLRPEDYQAVLVSIIRDCQRDGAETEREECAQLLDNLAQGYDHTRRETYSCGFKEISIEYSLQAAALMKGAHKIRARSAEGGKA